MEEGEAEYLTDEWWIVEGRMNRWVKGGYVAEVQKWSLPDLNDNGAKRVFLRKRRTFLKKGKVGIFKNKQNKNQTPSVLCIWALI